MATTPLLISLTTPIEDTAMVLDSMTGTEGISQPFDYELLLLSTVGSADFTAVLGNPIAVTFTQADGTSMQYLHGTVTEFAQEGQDARTQTLYRARIRPAFFLLSMHSEYAIYQAKTVVEIIDAVFSARGFTAVRKSLTKTYTAIDYVVQYGESTFDFVCRLMESAGIFYFFEHTASADTLVLADDSSAHTAIPGTGTLQFRSGEADLLGVSGSLQQQLVPASYKMTDYNFTTPSTSLMSSTSTADTYQLAEYPGGYLTKDAGDSLASLRLSAFEAEAKTFHGRTRSSSMRSGYKFTLAGHSRADANAEWLILRLNATFQNGLYQASFDAVPATVEFRPPRHTPRNRIAGTQTALVTGKSGEEIWTDSYGRVKVKFAWDTTAAKDETTSCWVRVAQAWAGKAWGSVSTPRIGQEVVVTFLNGDPEQPLIVGSVYNAEQTMPYTLPADQTKTTWKTNSSKGGAGFNELRFEDKKDSEEVFLQAQKDLKVSVVKGDYAIDVLEGKETHTVKKTRDITVTGVETRTNSADFKHDISGKSSVTVTGDEAHTNSANFKQDVSGNFTLNVTGNLTIKATGSVAIESGTGFTAKGGTTMAVSGATSASVKAGTQLALEGSVSAELKGSAQTAIKGGIVQIN